MNEKDAVMPTPPLDDLLEQLPREIAPARDLWPEIAANMQQPRRQKHQPVSRWLKQTAMACGFILLGAVSYRLWLAPATTHEKAPLLAMLAQLQQQHQQQITQLEQSTEFAQWQHTGMTAPLSQGVEQLQQAANKIYQALQRDPQNQQLWQLWLWSQQRQIELLTQGQQLPANAQPSTQGIRI